MIKVLKKQIIENTEQERRSFLKTLLLRLPSLAFAIPGFALAILFPIEEKPYEWYDGIWHGWIAPCNMLIRYFTPETLYVSSETSLAYNICWWVFMFYGCFILLLLLIFNLNEQPWSYFSGIFINFKEQIRLNAEYEGRSVWEMQLSRLADTLSLTIPWFIIAMLFPIGARNTYGWGSGIWHGCIAPYNMVIRSVTPNTFYMASIRTESYTVCWYIFFATSIIMFLSMLVFNALYINSNVKVKFAHSVGSKKGTQTKDTDTRQKDVIVKTSIAERVIKVFISSTFRDMQSERDYLMTKVFPQLHLMAQDRNVRFIPIDLRWGITKEEAQSGKVLELCLQEIDNSSPFFIGIIGRRYGWRPSVDEYSKSDLLKNRYPWIEADIKQHLSVTEIEMQYGVLRKKERVQAVFFTTQASSSGILAGMDTDEGRLDSLKRKIVEDGRYPIFCIMKPEELGNKVLDIFTKYLNEYFPILDESSSTHLAPSPENDDTTVPKEYIPTYLKTFGKKLSEQQLNLLLSSTLSSNLVTLKSILDELLTFGNYEKLDQHLAYLLEARNPCELYEKILMISEQRYGRKQVQKFFSILRITNKGVDKKLLMTSCNISEVETSMEMPFSLRNIMMFFFQEFKTEFTKGKELHPFDQYFRDYIKYDADGRIMLSHEYLQEAIDTRYLSNSRNVKYYKRLIQFYEI